MLLPASDGDDSKKFRRQGSVTGFGSTRDIGEPSALEIDFQLVACFAQGGHFLTAAQEWYTSIDGIAIAATRNRLCDQSEPMTANSEKPLNVRIALAKALAAHDDVAGRYFFSEIRIDLAHQMIP